MRIAVLIYGRINKCIDHYDNMIENLCQNHHVDFFLSSDNSNQKLLDKFIILYKPVTYNNDAIHYDYDLGKYPGGRPEITKERMHNMTCHFINKNRLFILLEKYIRSFKKKYDCVVSLRIDAVFKNKFNFNRLKENTIYIPFGYDYSGINDQIAYGTLNVMKKYNSINPIKILENRLSIPHPENLTCANIYIHKLKIERPMIKYHLDR
jgi:hypothetical protein